MFPYFGTKTSLVKFYPRPTRDLIIEPFAGAAAYALRYWQHDILLVDRDPTIIKLWKWLQIVDDDYIRNIPQIEHAQNIDEMDWDCEEVKIFLGFIIAANPSAPRKTATIFTTTARPNRQRFTKNRIASHLHKIRHWQIECKSYDEIHNMEATWFIDPPYLKAGINYRYHHIDYAKLAEWCTSRTGQVIVCEGADADWLPFWPLKVHRGTHKMSTEYLWCNEPTYRQGQINFDILPTP